MGILTSMFTAVTGLSTYGNAMGVIGNNIANIGTAGFKSSRATFADLISSSISGASGGGQVGLGVYMNDVQTNFTQGSMTTTGNTFDLAIDGTGFYLLRNSSGINLYSRAGQFKVDNLGQVTDSSGALLQGYQADTNGNITNTVGNITLSSSAVAPQATTTATILGNLNATSTVEQIIGFIGVLTSTMLLGPAITTAVSPHSTASSAGIAVPGLPATPRLTKRL